MEHYADIKEYEFSGDCYTGSNWNRKKNQRAIEFCLEHWVAPTVCRNDAPLAILGMQTRVELVEFRNVGAWWYVRWRVSYPPDFDEPTRTFAKSCLTSMALSCTGKQGDEITEAIETLTAAELEQISKNFYQSITNHTNPKMAKKAIMSVERQLEKLLGTYRFTKGEKEKATENHGMAYSDLETFCKIHRSKINPENEGVRFLEGDENDDDKGVLVSFHQHTEVFFTAAFDLAKAYKRVPQAFKVNAEKGNISVSVEDIKFLMNDKKMQAVLEKLGIATRQVEVFYVGK